MAEDNQQQQQDTSFADGESQQQQQQDTAATANAGGDNQEGDRVFMVVGDRAYQTKDSVATKIQNQDAHIVKIEGENQTLRAENTRLVAETERLKLAMEGMKPGTTSGNASEDNRQLSSEELVQTVVQQVTSNMTNKEREAQRLANFNTVFAEASTSYGEKVKEKVADIAKSLQMTVADADELAKTKPQAFRQLFLPKRGGTSSSTPPVQGDVRTAAMNGAPDDKPFSAKNKSSKEIAGEVQRRLSALAAGE